MQSFLLLSFLQTRRGLFDGLADELDDLGEGEGAQLAVVLLEVGQVLVQLLLAHARQADPQLAHYLAQAQLRRCEQREGLYLCLVELGIPINIDRQQLYYNIGT